MINLLKIELEKYRLSKVILSIGLFNLIIIVLLLALGMSTGGIYMFETIDISIQETNNAIIWPACLVFTCIWSVKIFIQEFREKTIMNIFASGNKRIHVVLSKLIFILIIGFVLTIVTSIVSGIFLGVTSSVTYYTREDVLGFSFISQDFLVNVLVNAGMLSITSLIGVAAGMKKYSVSVTFVVTLIVAVIWATQINFPFLFLTVFGIRIIIQIIGILSFFVIIRKSISADI